MCGFPLVHLDRHLKRLVQVHKRFAAVCEEFKKRDGTFERRVARVVTPGTLIDESFVNAFENNYLLAIAVKSSLSTEAENDSTSDIVGLAWTDVATGEFFSQAVPMENLRDEIARIGPREVVLPSWLADEATSSIRQALAEEEATVSYISLPQLPPQPASRLELATSNEDVQPSVITDDPLADEETTHAASTLYNAAPILSSDETQAITVLQAFLRESLLEHLPQDSTAIPSLHQTTESRMQIDAHTIKALELRESNREGGITGSLMNVVKRTVTSGGTRLLGRWLCKSQPQVPAH